MERYDPEKNGTVDARCRGARDLHRGEGRSPAAPNMAALISTSPINLRNM